MGNAGLVRSFEDGGNPPSLRILRHTMGQHGPNRDFPIATVRKLSRWQDTVSNEPIDVLAGDPQQLGRLGRTDLSLFADKHNRLAVAKGTRPHNEQPNQRWRKLNLLRANDDTQTRMIPRDQFGDSRKAARLARIRLERRNHLAGHDENTTHYMPHLQPASGRSLPVTSARPGSREPIHRPQRDVPLLAELFVPSVAHKVKGRRFPPQLAPRSLAIDTESLWRNRKTVGV